MKIIEWLLMRLRRKREERGEDRILSEERGEDRIPLEELKKMEELLLAYHRELNGYRVGMIREAIILDQKRKRDYIR